MTRASVPNLSVENENRLVHRQSVETRRIGVVRSIRAFDSTDR
ncbi:hypothetical protein DM2_277 [Halorubrum sp. DM2]|nr:hypothetical protein DM2_277 [Halorubrum sp. DM2]